MTKARDLADLGNKTSLDEINDAYDAGALSNRNLIINGNFAVTQRADYSSSTSVASGAYSVDRWKANDPFNLQRFTGQVIDGIRTNYVKVSYNGTQTMGFMQLIEDKNYEVLRGQTITISAYVRTNQPLFGFRLYDGGQNYGPRFVADGNWHRATWTLTWSPSSPSYFQMMFDTYQGSFPTIGSGDYMDIAMVQVELGKVATPFEHRSYGEELAKCQRYYYAFQVLNGLTGQNSFLAAAYSANTLYGVIDYPVQMRSNPSVLSGGTWHARNGNNNSFTLNLDFQKSGRNNGTVAQGSVGSSSTSDAFWVESQGSTGYLAFDAEL